VVGSYGIGHGYRKLSLLTDRRVIFSTVNREVEKKKQKETQKEAASTGSPERMN